MGRPRTSATAQRAQKPTRKAPRTNAAASRRGSRAGLPPLPIDHPLAFPRFDQIRVVVPKLVPARYRRSPVVELSEILGIPLSEMYGNGLAFRAEVGIAVFIDGKGTRIDYNGTFWSTVATQSRGLEMVRAAMLAFRDRYKLPPHLTRIDAFREFPGLSPLQVMRAPAEDVSWTFVEKGFNPVNQWGDVWVAGRRRA